MLEKQQLVRILLPSAAFLLLVAVSLIAWRRLAKPAPVAVASHRVETPPDEALKYWTADKMRKAGATNMPNTNAIKPGKKSHKRPSQKSQQQDS